MKRRIFDREYWFQMERGARCGYPISWKGWVCIPAIFLGPLGLLALSVWLEKHEHERFGIAMSVAAIVFMCGGCWLADWKTDKRLPL